MYGWAWCVFDLRPNIPENQFFSRFGQNNKKLSKLKQQNAFHGFLDKNGFNLTLYSNLEGFIEGLRGPTVKVEGTVHLEQLEREVRRRLLFF